MNTNQKLYHAAHGLVVPSLQLPRSLVAGCINVDKVYFDALVEAIAEIKAERDKGRDD